MSFSGVAQYDIFSEIGEDISPLVSMISPNKTPFLDMIGDSAYPIFSKAYSWEEKSLLPETFATSSAVASTAAASGGLEFGTNANLLRVGDILKNRTNGEQIFVTSLGANAATIYVTRAYATTSATSLAAGQVFEFLGSAVEEGSSPRVGRRVAKYNALNYVQTFREEIQVSNLANNAMMKWQMGQGSTNLPASPYDEEVADKTIEVMLQLEKTILMGRTNGNTIGADGVETTLAGIYSSIAATNIVSHATFSNSILNVTIGAINEYTNVRANSENYFLLCGDTAIKRLSNSREARVRQDESSTRAGLASPTVFDTDYGAMPLVYGRTIPRGSVLVLRKDFIAVKPFAGNSFRTRQYDLGTSAQTGYVEGTYGLEFRHLQSHARLDGII